MRRPVRNRLAELLLSAFDDPGKGDAILWLKLFCDLAGRLNRPQVPLASLLAEGEATFRGRHRFGQDVLARLVATWKMFCVRRADTGEEMAAGLPVQEADAPWLIELEPNARPALMAVCGRARTYAEVLRSLDDFDAASPESSPLRRAMRQAAACFNAGLFFEAHEHLERFWRCQPKGPTSRFLQGIIQISVGFHHAQRGSYDGAVNQLAKGLEKTAGASGEVLGLDCDAFLPAVARMREDIVAGGREAMRPIRLVEIPHMPVVGAS